MTTQAPAPPAALDPSGPSRSPSRRLDFDALVGNPKTRVVVCCGSGGVGKTTVAAALAVRAADLGRTVAVLTIDPARRLAQSLGLSHLDNTPREVPGFEERAGRLDAMMLDMKRTFDEIVLTHAEPRRAQQILANPFYQSLSSSFAGTQEYMAMEKLGQLVEEDRWDLIVVDTPPSRSALDFLDAPKRLGSFLDGRLIRMLTAPARAGGSVVGRMVSVGFDVVSGALNRILGKSLIGDVQTFVAAFDTMFGGFRERAERTYRRLAAPGTSFLVVATAEPDALREATYFVERLHEERMALAGLVLNRVAHSTYPALRAGRAAMAAEKLRVDGGQRLAAALLQLHSERMDAVAHDRRMRDRFSAAHPHIPIAEIPQRPVDVRDLPALRDLAASARK
jgi:anion-transporting  ArsA/GET3 family ATPase